MSVRNWVEAGLFGAVALVIHALAFATHPKSGGGEEAAGAGGDTLLTLQAASAAVARMVARYDAPLAPGIDLAEPLPAPKIEVPQIKLPPLVDLPGLPEIAPPKTKPEPEHESEPEVKPPPQPKPPKPKPRQANKPAPKAQTTMRNTAAQRARGQGGGANAGAQGAARIATVSPSRTRSLMAQWGAQIRSRIEVHKRYPGSAGRAHDEIVMVRLQITRTGQLLGVSIVRSSGQAVFDQAALQAVRAAGRFPQAPRELSDPSYLFSLPIRFSR